MMVSLLLILIAVLVGVAGQLSLKMGMNHVGTIDATSVAQPVETLSNVFRSPMVWVGLALYGLGAVAWLIVLSRLDLSFAYPFLALSYAITPILAWRLLDEPISALRWLGIAVIISGVLIVSRT
jgi:drug/metabolite transporter (DMT)-like permease